MQTLTLDDGSYAVLGASQTEDDMPSISRISAAGVLFNTKTYKFSDFSLESNVNASLTPIAGSADVLLHITRNPGNNAMCRVRPDGSLVYNVGYARSGVRMLSLPNGKIAML